MTINVKTTLMSLVVYTVCFRHVNISFYLGNSAWPQEVFELHSVLLFFLLLKHKNIKLKIESTAELNREGCIKRQYFE